MNLTSAPLNRIDGHMAIIYKAVHRSGLVYIGVSKKQALATRVAQHKCHSRFMRNEFHRLVVSEGIEQFKFSVIETVPDSDRFTREKFWISRFKKMGKSLNNSDGGQGPNGVKHTGDVLENKSKRMRFRWKKSRIAMLRFVNAHKTPEFQSRSGILGGYAKAAKQRFFTVTDRSTGKLLGRFQTSREFAKTIGVTESTSGRYLSGKLKKGNELYKFVWE